ncbi:MAG: hypothetical protein EBT61_18085 [Verrucomicrobia bacterium]|nr:hypothetical protein [Verrucomicrobiota bacterium]
MSYYASIPNSNATTATVNGPPVWERPFPDLTAELVLRQNYIQKASTFTPTALDTAHPDFPDMYLVDEGPREDIGGFYKWQRTYARIPPARTVMEGYAWYVPGIGTGAVYAAQSISSTSNSAGVTTITAASSPTISVGDQCSVRYNFTDSTTGTVYGRQVLRTALTGTSGTTVKVALISEAVESLEVASQLQLDYWLPGASTGVTTAFDIPLIRCLEIYDGTGTKVQSFTSSTTPTLAEWRAHVAAKDKICVVSSVLTRWMGNIYQRATRYCIAQ